MQCKAPHPADEIRDLSVGRCWGATLSRFQLYLCHSSLRLQNVAEKRCYVGKVPFTILFTNYAGTMGSTVIHLATQFSRNQYTSRIDTVGVMNKFWILVM